MLFRSDSGRPEGKVLCRSDRAGADISLGGAYVRQVMPPIRSDFLSQYSRPRPGSCITRGTHITARLTFSASLTTRQHLLPVVKTPVSVYGQYRGMPPMECLGRLSPIVHVCLQAAGRQLAERAPDTLLQFHRPHTSRHGHRLRRRRVPLMPCLNILNRPYGQGAFSHALTSSASPERVS